MCECVCDFGVIDKNWGKFIPSKRLWQREHINSSSSSDIVCASANQMQRKWWNEYFLSRCVYTNAY